MSVSDRGPDDRGESASCLEDSLPSRLFYVRSPHEVQTMSKNQQGCPLIPSSQRESVVAVAFVVCCCRCCCFPKPSPKIGCPIHRGLIAMSGNVNLSPLLSLSLSLLFCLSSPEGICFCTSQHSTGVNSRASTPKDTLRPDHQ